MTELKKYTGGCHCGKVRYEVEADLSGEAIACNCSMCSRMGWLLTFVPADKFTLLSGSEVLKDYQFNTKNIHHLFCSNCGIRSFARGTAPNGQETRAINIRCLDDVDISSIKVRFNDGKSR